MKKIKLILLLLFVVLSVGYDKMVQADNRDNSNVKTSTDIFRAVRNKDISSVQKFINSGINLNAIDTNNETVLTIAVKIPNSYNIVKLLLDNGANVEGYYDPTKDGDDTPLYWSVVVKDNHEVVKLLINAGADANVFAQGNNVLQRAVSRYYSEDGDFIFDNIKVLVENGADVNSEDFYGYSLLMLAAMNDDLKFAKLLIKNGANINHTSYEGEGMDNALLLATQEGNIEIVKLLLNNGADVNYVNEQGMTALFIATNDGYNSIARLLKSAGGKQ